MKKGFLIFAATLSLASAAAQNVEPRTALYVNIAVERQETIAGPYARYTQKYLDVLAPLADKVSHEVKCVKVLENDELPFSNERIIIDKKTSHKNPERGFPKLTVDRMSNTPQSLEENARVAAARIFEIRKNRYELVSGEAGENVFGGGLSSAIYELDRLEEEHLALFLGKHTTNVAFKQFRIMPEKDKQTYTVCRFSETEGIVPADDMSGRPVVLELKPLAPWTQGLNIQEKATSKTVPYRVPVEVQCRIIFDGRELASETITINQFAETVLILNQ